MSDYEKAKQDVKCFADLQRMARDNASVRAFLDAHRYGTFTSLEQCLIGMACHLAEENERLRKESMERYNRTEALQPDMKTFSERERAVANVAAELIKRQGGIPCADKFTTEVYPQPYAEPHFYGDVTVSGDFKLCSDIEETPIQVLRREYGQRAMKEMAEDLRAKYAAIIEKGPIRNADDQSFAAYTASTEPAYPWITESVPQYTNSKPFKCADVVAHAAWNDVPADIPTPIADLKRHMESLDKMSEALTHFTASSVEAAEAFMEKYPAGLISPLTKDREQSAHSVNGMILGMAEVLKHDREQLAAAGDAPHVVTHPST